MYLSESNEFEPVLFFYKWQVVIQPNILAEPDRKIGSGIIRAVFEDHLVPQNLINSIKEDLVDQGWQTECVNAGRLLDIKRV
jgi:hypothetical protein